MIFVLYCIFLHPIKNLLLFSIVAQVGKLGAGFCLSKQLLSFVKKCKLKKNCLLLLLLLEKFHIFRCWQ